MSSPTFKVPDARAFTGSAYLKSHDVPETRTVNIRDVQVQTLGSSPKPRLIVFFAEFQKGMVLNTTNNQFLQEQFGTYDYRNWRGPVTLYVDPHVEYQGQRTGGLRLAKPSNQATRLESQPDNSFSNHPQ